MVVIILLQRLILTRRSNQLITNYNQLNTGNSNNQLINTILKGKIYHDWYNVSDLSSHFESNDRN